jgi:hypothetical protein
MAILRRRLSEPFPTCDYFQCEHLATWEDTVLGKFWCDSHLPHSPSNKAEAIAISRSRYFPKSPISADIYIDGWITGWLAGKASDEAILHTMEDKNRETAERVHPALPSAADSLKDAAITLRHAREYIANECLDCGGDLRGYTSDVMVPCDCPSSIGHLPQYLPEPSPA